jgi:hypothetical protein
MNKPEIALKFLSKIWPENNMPKKSDIERALIIAFEEGKGNKEPAFNMTEYERFKTLISNRISKKGIIRTGEAWDITKEFGYSRSTIMMRYTLDKLVEEGKAEKIRKGVWIIY